jgi:hypothetical protein
MNYSVLVDSFSRRQEYLLIELLRAMTGSQRLALSGYITKLQIERSRAEIAKAHPEFSPLEIKLKWVEITYGKELGDGLRADIERRAELGEYPMGK